MRDVTEVLPHLLNVSFLLQILNYCLKILTIRVMQKAKGSKYILCVQKKKQTGQQIVAMGVQVRRYELSNKTEPTVVRVG